MWYRKAETIDEELLKLQKMKEAVDPIATMFPIGKIVRYTPPKHRSQRKPYSGYFQKVGRYLVSSNFSSNEGPAVMVELIRWTVEKADDEDYPLTVDDWCLDCLSYPTKEDVAILLVSSERKERQLAEAISKQLVEDLS